MEFWEKKCYVNNEVLKFMKRLENEEMIIIEKRNERYVLEKHKYLKLRWISHFITNSEWVLIMETDLGDKKKMSEFVKGKLCEEFYEVLIN